MYPQYKYLYRSRKVPYTCPEKSRLLVQKSSVSAEPIRSRITKLNLIIILVIILLQTSVAPTFAQEDVGILLPFFSNDIGHNTSMGGSEQVDTEADIYTADAAAPVLQAANSVNVIENQYIVVLKEEPAINLASSQPVRSIVNSVIDEVVTDLGSTTIQTYTNALAGFAGELNAQTLVALQNDSRVDYIVPNQIYTINEEQPSPTWGLDRIDTRDLPMDNTYGYESDGTGVDVYILDTGVRSSHTEFGGRVVGGYSATGDSYDDCNGHGTHVAGTIGGNTYGVAKNVSIYAVRVIDCDGRGSTADVIAGIDWVTQNATGPSVANMSLSGMVNSSIDAAVRNSIAAGIFYAVASGNSGRDACQASPARVAEALTVNASDNNDNRASFSNYGSCTDIFAPGQNIRSAWNSDDNSTNTISGTSMAAPHAAGVAALYLANDPTASPRRVFDALLENATPGKISNPGSGSPNLLLYSQVSQSVKHPRDQFSSVASTVSLQIEVNNFANRDLAFSATDLPAGLDINSATGLITGNPTTEAIYQTTVSAAFGGSSSESISFEWSIVAEDALIQYDFESQQGWEANPAGTDTATSGRWERATPEQTTFRDISLQYGATVSGQTALITGGSAGGSAETNDVDGGSTSIRSPEIVIPANAQALLSFSYYLAHLDNASSADYLRVSAVGATTTQITATQIITPPITTPQITTTQILEERGAAQNKPGSWSLFTGNLNEFAGQTIFLLVEAADAEGDSLVEAAIDDVELLIVIANQPPELATVTDQTNIVGELVNLTITAIDPDDDALTFSQNGLPAGLELDADSGQISGTLTAEGTSTVTIQASDSSGGADTVSFTWTIEPRVALLLGDTNCSGHVDSIDALFVLQFSIGRRTDAGGCPLVSAETMLNISVADVDANGYVNAIDALFIMQCTVDLNNVLCPAH